MQIAKDKLRKRLLEYSLEYMIVFFFIFLQVKNLPVEKKESVKKNYSVNELNNSSWNRNRQLVRYVMYEGQNGEIIILLSIFMLTSELQRLIF